MLTLLHVLSVLHRASRVNGNEGTVRVEQEHRELHLTEWVSSDDAEGTARLCDGDLVVPLHDCSRLPVEVVACLLNIFVIRAKHNVLRNDLGVIAEIEVRGLGLGRLGVFDKRALDGLLGHCERLDQQSDIEGWA